MSIPRPLLGVRVIRKHLETYPARHLDRDIDVEMLRVVARRSPCKVIKFAATNGWSILSYNGQYYADCEGCNRTEIEQAYPDCKASHAEWGVLLYKPEQLFIYCMTPDGEDYPFERFWCRTCAILIPMFGVTDVWTWTGTRWKFHNPDRLMDEVDNKEIVG